MGVVKLSTAGILDYQKYSSALAGNSPYIPPAPSAYDLLETEILTGSQASVTFSSLNSTYGADYQHLQIRATHLHTASNGTILGQFNSDTGSSYRVHALRGNGSAVSSADYGSRTSLVLGVDVPNTTTPAAAVIDLLDPFETSKYLTVRSLAGYGSGGNINLYSGLWLNTAALTTITLTGATNFNTGSRFSLYGLKAA